MELLKTCLTYSYWLFRGGREGVFRGTLSAENVSTMSTMVLEERDTKETVNIYNLKETEIPPC